MSARLAACAGLAGALAAAALPGHRPGLGVLLVAGALAMTVVCARVEPAGASGWRRAFGGLALALSALAVVRDAAWVVWPALGAALLLGSLAGAGGATLPSVLRGLVAAPLAAPRGALAVARVAAGAAPRDARAHVAPALRGAALALVLVGVFGGLFVSSDAAFAEMAEDALLTEWDAGLLWARLAILAGVVALAGGYALAAHGGPLGGDLRSPRRTLAAAEWGIPLAALIALFAAFVAVQFSVLFGANEHVLWTAGLTYAEYAREGFAQLLVAVALTLAVVAAALRYATGCRGLLRAALAALCALTAVVLVSALHRLDLYTDAYGATRLRLSAQAALLFLGALLAMVLIALATDRHRWVPRTVVLVSGLAVLAFGISNPDRRIAERNLRATEVDRAYLHTLSADAVPVLPPDLAATIRARLGDDGWGGLNLSRTRTR